MVNQHVLSTADQRGNADLLRTRKLGLLCSAKCPGTLIVQTLELALALRDAAVTVVGGFHSSMEKECLATLLRGKHPVIVCPARSVVGMRMPAAWKQAIADGTLLVTSPFGTKFRRPTAKLADQRNRFVLSLSDEIIVAHGNRLFPRRAGRFFAINCPLSARTFSRHAASASVEPIGRPASRLPPTNETVGPAESFC